MPSRTAMAWMPTRRTITARTSQNRPCIRSGNEGRMALPPVRAEQAGDVAQNMDRVITQGAVRLAGKEDVPAKKEQQQRQEHVEIPGSVWAVHSGLLALIIEAPQHLTILGDDHLRAGCDVAE